MTQQLPFTSYRSLSIEDTPQNALVLGQLLPSLPPNLHIAQGNILNALAKASHQVFVSMFHQGFELARLGRTLTEVLEDSQVFLHTT